MYTQNNKQQQENPLVCRSHGGGVEKTEKTNEKKNKWEAKKKLQLQKKNNNKTENYSELSEKEFTFTYNTYGNGFLSLTHDQIRTYRKAQNDETTTATSHRIVLTPRIERQSKEACKHIVAYHHRCKSPLNGVHLNQQWHITMAKWQTHKASEECKKKDNDNITQIQTKRHILTQQTTEQLFAIASLLVSVELFLCYSNALKMYKLKCENKFNE